MCTIGNTAALHHSRLSCAPVHLSAAIAVITTRARCVCESSRDSKTLLSASGCFYADVNLKQQLFQFADHTQAASQCVQ